MTDLRDAFAASSDAVGECPDAEHLWEAAHGELDTEHTGVILDHLATCGACSEDWRLAREVGGPVAEVVPLRPRTGRWWTAGGALLLAAAVLLVVRLDPPVPEGEPGWRAPAGEEVRSLVPEILPRAAPVLRWSPGPPGARYTLTVTTDRLKPVAELRGLTVAEQAIPVAGLAPGTRLLWRVRVLHPDGSVQTSPTFEVVIE